MPFGLKSSAQTSQRFVDDMVRDHPDAFAYVDDILLATEDEKSHKKALDELLQTLDTNGMRIN
jgi:hypothetical protein